MMTVPGRTASSPWTFIKANPGLLNIPVDELTAVHLLSGHFLQEAARQPVVAPTWACQAARAFAELMEAPAGHSSRSAASATGPERGPSTSSATSAASGPIIVDDESTTAGTLIQIVNALEREGVTEMYACAHPRRVVGGAVGTHRRGQLCEGRRNRLDSRIPPEKRGSKIKVISLAPLIAEAIVRIHRGQSVALSSQAKSTSPRDASLDVDSQTDRTPDEGDNGRSGEPAGLVRPVRAVDVSGR